MVADAVTAVAEACRRHMRAAVEADRSRHIAEVDTVVVEELHILLRRIEAVAGCKSIRNVILCQEPCMKPTGILEEGIAAEVGIHCCIVVVEDSPDCGSSVLESPT